MLEDTCHNSTIQNWNSVKSWNAGRWTSPSLSVSIADSYEGPLRSLLQLFSLRNQFWRVGHATDAVDRLQNRRVNLFFFGSYKNRRPKLYSFGAMQQNVENSTHPLSSCFKAKETLSRERAQVAVTKAGEHSSQHFERSQLCVAASLSAARKWQIAFEN